jgi:hypothetical protein
MDCVADGVRACADSLPLMPEVVVDRVNPTELNAKMSAVRRVILILIFSSVKADLSISVFAFGAVALRLCTA